MSDTLRTALRSNGGNMMILIDVWANGSVELQVTENWHGVTSVEKALIPADRLDAAEDPDRLIGEEIAALVMAAHINPQTTMKEEDRGYVHMDLATLLGKAEPERRINDGKIDS